MKPAVLLFFLFATLALGATDSPPIDPSDDFSPMMLAFALVGICIVLVLVGVGIVVAAIIAVSSAVLVALGIVSSAAIVGLLRRRFSSGLRALHYQVCAVAAIPAGVGVLWLVSHFFTEHLRHRYIVAIGSFAGICGGLLLAFAFDRLASMAYRHFVTPSLPNPTGNA